MPEIDKIFENLGSTLQNRESRHSLARKFHLLATISLAIITVIYLIFLIFLTIGIHWFAERNVALAFFSYLPPQFWILPLPVLLVPSLLCSRKLALCQLLILLGFVFLHMDYQLRPFSRFAPDPGAFTILSYNRGQHRNQSLQPFKNKIFPDAVALQGAKRRGNRYAAAPEYQEFPFVDEIGEFVLLSKFPITGKERVTLPLGERDYGVAGRFLLDFHGQTIAVYNVHLPTPRDVLSYYRRGAFLYGIFGVPGTPWGAKRKANQKYWDHRVRLASEFALILENDPLPFVAVGDFNMPHHGVAYRLFTRNLEDAHKKAGHGFGYTFPGYTRNPLTLGGPWLRLDYAFCNDGWKTRDFLTENERTSQHRAVAASFSLIRPREELSSANQEKPFTEPRPTVD